MELTAIYKRVVGLDVHQPQVKSPPAEPEAYRLSPSKGLLLAAKAACLYPASDHNAHLPFLADIRSYQFFI